MRISPTSFLYKKIFSQCWRSLFIGGGRGVALGVAAGTLHIRITTMQSILSVRSKKSLFQLQSRPKLDRPPNQTTTFFPTLPQTNEPNDQIFRVRNFGAVHHVGKLVV